MISSRALLAATLTLSVCTTSFASPGMTGRSGAPGLQNCASSCHGEGTGSCQVTGFPEIYTPDSTYLVKLYRTGGSNISNFNASCRIGEGADNAGTIASGYRTSTYSVTGETNGVHLSQNNRDSCTFEWTAPASGIGQVRLYVAAHQGNYSGPNNDFVLVAEESDIPLPPDQVTNPYPADGAVNVPLPVILSWDEADRADHYDIYLGVSPEVELISSQTFIQYGPVLLPDPAANYYWRVDAVNDAGVTEGELWQFALVDEPGIPQNPVPANQETGVPMLIVLGWDPAPRAETYRLTIEENQEHPAPFVDTVLAATTFGPYMLPSALATYFWRVDAINSFGTTQGPGWSFSPNDSLPLAATNPDPPDGAMNFPVDDFTISWTTHGSAFSYTFAWGTELPIYYADFTFPVPYWDGSSLEYNTTYYWRVKAWNLLGYSESETWEFTTVSDLASDEPAVPSTTHLGSPYPNPFNATSTIPFELNRAQHVKIAVFDLQGRLVNTLLDEQLTSGKHAFLWQADNIPSGVYFARLTTPEFTSQTKLLLLK